jgi:hypothetical protein
MITMGSPYFVWINANEIVSSWYLRGAVCVAPPPYQQVRGGAEGHDEDDEGHLSQSKHRIKSHFSNVSKMMRISGGVLLERFSAVWSGFEPLSRRSELL